MNSPIFTWILQSWHVGLHQYLPPEIHPDHDNVDCYHNDNSDDNHNEDDNDDYENNWQWRLRW